MTETTHRATDPVVASFIREVRVDAPPSTVYDAIATIRGIRGWWTPLAAGGEAPGAVIDLRFQGLDEVVAMRVDRLQRPHHVAWTCLRHTGHPEWEGTGISFDVQPRGGGSVLTLTHDGLVPQLHCYEQCQSGWQHFLGSIRSYAELGVGAPFAGSR